MGARALPFARVSLSIAFSAYLFICAGRHNDFKPLRTHSRLRVYELNILHVFHAGIKTLQPHTLNRSLALAYKQRALATHTISWSLVLRFTLMLSLFMCVCVCEFIL